MTATTALRSEHNHILAMIACLRAACDAAEECGELDVAFFQSGVEFIRNYADAWHHAKEEELLFPALEASGMPRDGGPIAVMLHEHEIGRSYVRQIADNLNAAGNGDDAARAAVLRFTLAYADLLTQHIQKENGVLFNMADQFLPRDEQMRLEQEYQSAIPSGADAVTGARYEKIVADQCRRWNIDPREAAAIGDAFACG